MMTARMGVALTATLLAASCSDGGDEDTPLSEVQISRTHHLVGMIGPLEMTEFPLEVDDLGALPLAGTLAMTPDDRYSLTATSNVQVDDRYALETSGEFSVLIARPQASTLVYGGGYGLAGDTGHWFFTDRVTTRVGLYFGAPLVAGAADITQFQGDWHVFGLHVIYAADGTLPSIHEVGRSYAGSVAVDAAGAFTGNVRESVSPAAALPVTGSLNAFQDGAFRASLDLGGGVVRRFDGGGTSGLIALAQTEQTADGAGGLAAFMKHRTSPIDVDQLAGVYEIGAWNLFLNPGDAGFDAALGTLELTAQGRFVMRLRNNTGDDIAYDGDWAAQDDGTMTFAVVSPAETWLGAVDEGNDTIVLVDHTTATAGGVRTAIRMFFAVRRAE